MLKLPKALKKKKKGKRSKKDQELFTEEELAEYKKQIQQKQQENNKDQNDGSNVDSEEQQQESSTEDKLKEDDEWLKFKTLTAGVDSLLHKTQDDLDRIKSTSFFQRVPPPSEKKNQAKEDQNLKEKEVEEKTEKNKENTVQDKLADAVVELSDLDEDSEDSDDIFDTAYIDAITSGEVQLTVVPDSPVLEVNEGPDPFDTSYADELIQGPAVSKRGKKLVNIGAAVEVLTGKLDSTHVATSTGVKRKPRRGIQNLLLDDYDSSEAAAASDISAPKSLLDDPAGEATDNVPIDLSVSLHLTLKNPEKSEDKEKNVESETFVEEFEVNEIQQEEIDEFAELAADSLTKKEEIVVVTQPQAIKPTINVETDWAHFEQTKEEEKEENLNYEEKFDDLNEEDKFVVDGDDPFDTAFAEKIIPKTETETETQQINFETQTSANTYGNLNEEKIQDLFDINEDDLLAAEQVSILPITNTATSADFDPFDTSTIETLVQPKNTELKFLEQELLTDFKLQHSLSDPDFDPRGEESKNSEVQHNSPEKISPKTCDQYSNLQTIRRKSSLSLNLETKSVAFLVPANKENNGKVHKPLTPYCAEVLEKEDTEDPFDTSFILDQNENRKSSLSDSDFDPRADEKPEKLEENNLDFLVVEEQIDIKVLTPAQQNNSKETEFDDPFDTSSIAANILPGKTELRIIENELLPAKPESVIAVLDTQTDVQELGLGDKVLTPQTSNTEQPSEEVDPFDTSFVENLKPGKTELKLLETEFIQP